MKLALSFINYVTIFQEVIEKGLSIENILLEQGTIKIYKDNKDDLNSNNKDKPRFWNKNKNTINDGVVDENMVKMTHSLISFL